MRPETAYLLCADEWYGTKGTGGHSNVGPCAADETVDCLRRDHRTVVDRTVRTALVTASAEPLPTDVVRASTQCHIARAGLVLSTAVQVSCPTSASPTGRMAIAPLQWIFANGCGFLLGSFSNFVWKL